MERFHYLQLVIRDWSLITGRGGLQNGRGGGACEVLPLRKGGAEKVLAMLKGGTKNIGLVFTRLLEVLAILKGEGGTKSFHSLKGGQNKLYPVLRGGAKSL